MVFVSASGLRQQAAGAGFYSARILGTEVAGHRLSAIQRTTAAGICTALDLVVQGGLPQQGFRRAGGRGCRNFYTPPTQPVWPGLCHRMPGRWWPHEANEVHAAWRTGPACASAGLYIHLVMACAKWAIRLLRKAWAS